MVIAIAGSFFWWGIEPRYALFGGIVAFVFSLHHRARGRGAMGRGDTKLAIFIGLMSGFPSVFGALLIGILTGGAIAALLLVTGRGRKTTFAYGPALAIGAVISLVIRSH